MAANDITMRELALRAGVSTATVSLALRNDHRLSPATRQRIQALADTLGYRRDPVVARMMAQLPKGRRGHAPVLAFVTDHPSPFCEMGTDKDISCWHGAQRQARAMGYELKEFLLSPAMPGPKLSRILWNRGVEGILIGPLQKPATALDLTWNRFAAVALGHSLAVPRLDCVSNNQFNSGTLAVQCLYDRGYRRMGLIHTTEREQRVNYALEASFATACRRCGIPVQVTSDDMRTDDDLLAWVKQHRLDALLVPSYAYRTMLPRLPQSCKYTSLHLHPSEKEVSGVDQRWDALGEQAVNLLISRIHAGQNGIPSFPVTVNGESRWVDGTTT